MDLPLETSYLFRYHFDAVTGKVQFRERGYAADRDGKLGEIVVGKRENSELLELDKIINPSFGLRQQQPPCTLRQVVV